MEVNLDQDFLMQFSCMGTQDKDVLISELHGILDSQLSREGCAFFLDMTNWNLQAAVGAFYDHYSNEGGVLPEMTLVERKSVAGQNAATLTLPANTVFTETWTLKNTGTMPWPLGVHLALKMGVELLSNLQTVHLPNLPPGGETSLTLEFHAPSTPGVYHSQWRACTGGGALFGDPVWVIVRVQEDPNVLGLVNQLSAISTHEAEMESEAQTEREPQQPASNPFAMPSGYQDHSFVPSSIMGSPSSGGTCLERILNQNHPPSPVLPDLEAVTQGAATTGLSNTGLSNTSPCLDTVRTSADSTNNFTLSAHPVPNQNQTPEWNSATVSGQNQTSEWDPSLAPPQQLSSQTGGDNPAAMMESNNDINPT